MQQYGQFEWKILAQAYVNLDVYKYIKMCRSVLSV